MRRDSFVCYKSFYDAIKQLSDEDFARCMRAICEYALNGAEVDIQGVSSVVFQLVKPQIDANNRKFLNGMRGKECGKLGKEKTDLKKQVTITTRFKNSLTRC